MRPTVAADGLAVVEWGRWPGVRGAARVWSRQRTLREL